MFILTANEQRSSFILDKVASLTVVKLIAMYSYEIYIVQGLILFKYDLFTCLKQSFDYMMMHSWEYILISCVLLALCVAASVVSDRFLQKPLQLMFMRSCKVVSSSRPTRWLAVACVAATIYWLKFSSNNTEMISQNTAIADSVRNLNS